MLPEQSMRPATPPTTLPLSTSTVADDHEDATAAAFHPTRPPTAPRVALTEPVT